MVGPVSQAGTSHAIPFLLGSASGPTLSPVDAIRDQADLVLKSIEHREKQKSLAWKCVACGHTKRFTRPVSAEVAAPCPKCGGEKFDPA
jgi:predicted RNA-binding Zn-ribbon protein involved in translation (DUF1610 family)